MGSFKRGKVLGSCLGNPRRRVEVLNLRVIHRDQKRQEFFRLRQLGKSVTEYETELRELAEFVPEMVGSKEYLCSKFEEGLNLEI